MHIGSSASLWALGGGAGPATPDKRHPGLSPASLLRCYSPNQTLASDMSTSLLSPRSLCQGVTRAGQPCRKKAVLGQNFCHVHA
ncbi:hypothetical protein Y1Q_0015771 [Alligator mississippiensis]|uniref:Uncharacterized protein n=1 Tax=Alligator mississippiensis TaxID=8496 RepID=A0A151PJ41_ALLMI|nr:hypothetical protein Y1Q_0015771 [Alligator mississippiensis]